MKTTESPKEQPRQRLRAVSCYPPDVNHDSETKTIIARLQGRDLRSAFPAIASVRVKCGKCHKETGITMLYKCRFCAVWYCHACALEHFREDNKLESAEAKQSAGAGCGAAIYAEKAMAVVGGDSALEIIERMERALEDGMGITRSVVAYVNSENHDTSPLVSLLFLREDLAKLKQMQNDQGHLSQPGASVAAKKDSE